MIEVCQRPLVANEVFDEESPVDRGRQRRHGEEHEQNEEGDAPTAVFS